MEKPQEAPGFGAAQKQKLTELLDKIREFHFSVSIDDFDNQYAFSLTVRDLVLQLQALAAPILPDTIAIRLDSIDVDVQDFDSAASARAELDALVPAVEDALQAIDRRPGTLLSGSLRQLLEERNLDPVSEEIQRALDAAESDPPVAITAARAALESLLHVSCYWTQKQAWQVIFGSQAKRQNSGTLRTPSSDTRWLSRVGGKADGGSSSMWVRLPPRAFFESHSPQAAQEIESLFPSLAGDLWIPWVGPRGGGGGPDFFPLGVLNRPAAPTTCN